MPRALWLLIIGMAVNVTASSFLWPLNAIYIHEHLGKSLSVAGLILMANALASVAGNLVGGGLFDRIGGYKTILIGTAITLLSLVGLTVNHDYLYYIVFLTISGFGTGIIFPAIYAMAGSAWKEGGRRAFNAIYVAQNLGVAVGSALGGWVASFSFDYIFTANAGLFFVFFLIAVFGYKGMNGQSSKQTVSFNEQRTVKNNSKIYALFLLCFGYFLCWIGYVQWQSTISAYTQEIGISLKQYSLLWTINGALIVAGQPLVNILIKLIAKTMKIQLILGMAIFIISFSVAANASAFAGFLTAMVILTIGEMFVWPAVPSAANELSPKGKEGFYQGVVNSTATGGRMIGPLLGGFLVDSYGMGMMFIVLSVLFVAAIGTTLIYDRWMKTDAAEPKVVSAVK
ncbi:MFS transporter [Bacillus sp. M6-12]|uniref:MDR family MFS transporter n=1 Tax=Bacillus sp. M6-12 TaxID=2054166 RepID=UPI000C770C99|nr:MFS transporter [Bacillus sp. M6-12]PLS14932.1 MFS transporter [Bacillus sp. M6-12]